MSPLAVDQILMMTMLVSNRAIARELLHFPVLLLNVFLLVDLDVLRLKEIASLLITMFLKS